MAKKIKTVREKSWIEDEVIDTGEVEIIEEFLDIPEEKLLSELSRNLIRMDMNMIEYPLFSKNRKRKQNQVMIYYFNQRKDKYIEVRPASGDHIPGEFEEKVFIALTKLMRDKKYGQDFVVSAGEILANMNIDKSSTKRALFKQVKEAMLRLTQTSYKFKNTLYSNKDNCIINDMIVTNIMNIRILTRKDIDGDGKEYFADGRIKEVYKISLSKPFYDNILRKGYLVYNSELLLEMESSVTRSIYLLINKWRFNNLYLKEKVMTLIKRIPLKYSKATLSRTIKSIENSCNQLRDRRLIHNYAIIKDGTWEESEIEFFFEEEHNVVKQENFFSDKNQFGQLLISGTEEMDIEEGKEGVKVTPEMVEEIFEILPNRSRELKTMPKTISDGIKQYGFDKVKVAAAYVRKQKPTNIRSYFVKAMENEWGADLAVQMEAKKAEKASGSSQMSLGIETAPIPAIDYMALYEKISELDAGLAEKILQSAKDSFLKESSYTSFNASVKKIFELGKKLHLSKVMDEMGIDEAYIENQKKKEEKPAEIVEAEVLEMSSERILDIHAAKKQLAETIEKFKILYDMSPVQLESMKKRSNLLLAPHVLRNSITVEIIEEILEKCLNEIYGI